MLEIFGGTVCKFTDFLVTYLNVIVWRILNKIYFIQVLEFDITFFLCPEQQNKPKKSPLKFEVK